MAITKNGYLYTVSGSSVTGTPLNRTASLYGSPESRHALEVLFGMTLTQYVLSYSACRKLSRLPILRDGVTRLVCNNCDNLKNVTNLPQGLLDITFTNCPKLEAVPTIPSSVSVMSSCFEGCISLKGVIEINAPNLTSYTNCFKDTEQFIFICGSNEQRSALAETANNGNAEVFTAPANPPVWTTPVIDRNASSRTNYVDMNRIVQNLYLCGGYPYRSYYTSSMFVNEKEWLCIVQSVNNIADTLEMAHVNESTTYTNMNKLESILLAKHNA